MNLSVTKRNGNYPFLFLCCSQEKRWIAFLVGLENFKIFLYNCIISNYKWGESMQQERDRVHFFGRYDCVMAYELEKVTPVLNEFDDKKDYNDINEILELYGISRVLEATSGVAVWDSNTLQRYKAIGQKIRSAVGRFSAQIDNQNIIDCAEELEALYILDFLNLIEYYDVYERISGDVFLSILNRKGFALSNVLRHKKLVTHFGTQIADYMNGHSNESGVLLVERYLEEGSQEKKTQIFIPAELTLAQRESILMRYVESAECNLNMLNVLQNSQGTQELPVSDVLRLKAKRRYEKETDKHFAEHAGIKQEMKVGFKFGMPQAKEERFDKETLCAHAYYSSDWVKDNLDYPTLLNNFIYLFGYTDLHFRSVFPAFKSKSGVLEELFQSRATRNYPIYRSFRTTDMLSFMQMMAYCKELERYEINLENIFQWFFETYLPNEFGVAKIRYNTPTKGVTTLEKIRMLAPELECALKQYAFYCEHGEIDQDLLSVSTQPVIFSDLPSLQAKKYVYAANDECRRIQHHLFSSQSWLPGKEDKEGNYLPFGRAIMLGLISTDDITHIGQQIVDELQQKGIIKIGEDGIFVADFDKMAIYEELYDNEVICYQYCKKWTPLIDAMAAQGEVEFGATLFSVPEQHYLNFMLNNKEYSNGLWLRNKYMHSGYPQDEGKQQEDYIQLLKVTVLAIIKINEEFCLYFRE